MHVAPYMTQYQLILHPLRGTNVLKTTFTAIALSLVTSAASAAVLDFEDFVAGDILTNLGNGITVSATGGSGDAMVFDSNNATGGDDDLEAPFYDLMVDDPNSNKANKGVAAQGATAFAPGNILIISEDGDSSDPDDNGSGGVITFKFAEVITFLGFDVFDDVTNFTVSSDLGDSVVANLAFDNQFQSFNALNWTGVSEITFDFGNASGAIDNLRFTPVPLPASLPLMLVGMAGMGFAARRRAKS